MRLITFLTVLLFASTASAQLFPFPGKPGTYGGGGGSGPGLTLIWASDFEGAGGDDSGGTYTIDTFGSVDFNDQGGGDLAAVLNAFVDGVSAANTFSRSDDVTLDFTFDFSSAGTTANHIGGMDDVAANGDRSDPCGIVFDGDGTVNARSKGINSGTISISEGTDYYARMTFDYSAIECCLSVWSAGYGDTQVGTEQCATGGSVSPINDVEFFLEFTVDTPDYRIHDVALCEGLVSPIGTAGRCDS